MGASPTSVEFSDSKSPMPHSLRCRPVVAVSIIMNLLCQLMSVAEDGKNSQLNIPQPTECDSQSGLGTERAMAWVFKSTTTSGGFLNRLSVFCIEMKLLGAILALLTTSAVTILAAAPAPGASVGIQPTFRGTYPRTPCISVDGLFDGAGVFVIDCTTPIATRTFTIDAGGSSTGQGTPGPIRISGNLCLTVPGGLTTSGTIVLFTPCTSGDPNQQWQWNSDGTIVWAGKNKCLDLRDGQLYSYNKIQIWTCTANNQNQKWTSSPPNNLISQVSLTQNDVFCMGANSSANGAPVYITRCDDAKSRVVWNLPEYGSSGSYKFGFGPGNTAPFKCLDVTDGRAVAGTKLQLWDCASGNVNQAWTPTDTIRWLGTSGSNPFCVDVTNNIGTNYNQIWNCNGKGVQAWSSVWPPQTRA